MTFEAQKYYRTYCGKIAFVSRIDNTSKLIFGQIYIGEESGWLNTFWELNGFYDKDNSELSLTPEVVDPVAELEKVQAQLLALQESISD